MSTTFDNLLLLGQPASGKSELIDFMKGVPLQERIAKYHIGPFEELDDFPWIWEKFMEDNVWAAAGYPRRYSFGGVNPGMSAEGAPLLDFCIQKFNAEYKKQYQEHATFYQEGTLFIEFARGREKAYERALHQLSPKILKRASILFILVSYEEFCRRNNARYQAKLQSSVLAHKVPDQTLEYFYQDHDWLELTKKQESGTLKIGAFNIPFVTVNNEVEPKTPADYNHRYGPALRKLMELKNANI